MEKQFLENEIKHEIDQTIRPYLNSHGGDVVFLDYRDGFVTVRLTGACAGCPSADIDTRLLIEETLKQKYDINGVILDQETPQELWDLAKRILRNSLN